MNGVDRKRPPTPFTWDKHIDGTASVGGTIQTIIDIRCPTDGNRMYMSRPVALRFPRLTAVPARDLMFLGV